MKFSSFSQRIVTRAFDRAGESVALQINIDAFTPEYWRAVGERLQEQLTALEKSEKAKLKPRGKRKKITEATVNEAKARLFETEARGIEIMRDIYIEFLYPEVLKGWDLVEDDGTTLVPLNKDTLLRLPPRLVNELWDFCVAQSKTVKPPATDEPQSQTTVATTGDGSVTQSEGEGPIM